MKATPYISKERSDLWFVDQKFTTKPLYRCQDASIENPILEPHRISGSFTKYQEDAVFDRHGNKIAYSNHQLMRGQAVRFDNNRPNVTIEINVLDLQLPTVAGSIDTVNDSGMWGLEPRTIKLSNASWTRKLYGLCTYYYSIRYQFDINFKTWDKKIIDEGTMVLAPGGDPTNPEDFIQYKDCRGSNQRILLNGEGAPLADGDNPVEIPVEFYFENNFFVLPGGIPSSF